MAVIDSAPVGGLKGIETLAGVPFSDSNISMVDSRPTGKIRKYIILEGKLLVPYQ